MKILISDSTLRDGNHAVRHQLTTEQIKAYARKAEESHLDIVEVGHGNGLGASSSLLGHSAECDIDMLAAARSQLKKTLLGIHFIPGFGKSSDIDDAVSVGVDVLRIASHCTEANTTLRYIEQGKSNNKLVFGVLMMSHMATTEILIEQASLMEKYGADGIILMDSAGYYIPTMVRERIKALVNHLNVQVGFHAHNNLGLAVANSLAAAEEGASIIDACIMGFGAGAGNTQLENLIAVLERYHFDINTSFEIITKTLPDAIKIISHETPHIKFSNIASGLYGLFSGYVPHVQRAAKEFNVNEFDLYRSLSGRNLIAGQEDIIIEEAIKLSNNKS
ncbi:4-hydroxy-2-oxovalerate aldolase [Xenorhabdus ishibashii]|uniref:4-hydroxy-2-oxovalerate aldolase n=1 Tax=Xenorhabdus ishibashii TaxID=1034471 RepID=A0A2D0KHT2_9GAMM|nr:4-hydroxy-2-oxovalerate aldolase [Xenorhabdus ishibashii]PHM62993.1 4-hydroxy-2-oxovalerate aldolase [Xenorhabdus ishibashii]